MLCGVSEEILFFSKAETTSTQLRLKISKFDSYFFSREKLETKYIVTLK